MELLFPILLVGIAAMLFFQMRKQKKAMQQQQELQNSLTAGDRIMTTSGLYATVVDTDDDSVDLEIAEDVVVTYVRQAVRQKIEDTDEDSVDADTASDEADDAEADEATTEAAAEESKTQKAG